MQTYYARIISDSTGGDPLFLALVAAKNERDLFWTLDEFGDPYGFEFSRAKSGDAICLPVRQGESPEFVEADDSPDIADPTELSERAMDLGGRQWSRFIMETKNGEPTGRFHIEKIS